jgi:hydrogenase-4 component E
MDPLIRTLSLSLIATSFAVVVARPLRAAVVAYMAQALLMVAVLAAFARWHPALWTWAATAFVTKFALVSWLLWRAVRPGDDEQGAPRAGALPTVVLVAALAALSSHLVHRHAGFLAPTPELMGEPYRTNVAVSLTLFAVGLFAVLTRRDALKVVLGVCLMENGAHLSLVSLAPSMRETVLIGVVTDVVLAVYLLLVVIRAIESVTGSRDTRRLSSLRG